MKSNLEWTNVNTTNIKRDITNNVENKQISGNRRESHHSNSFWIFNWLKKLKKKTQLMDKTCQYYCASVFRDRNSMMFIQLLVFLIMFVLMTKTKNYNLDILDIELTELCWKWYFVQTVSSEMKLWSERSCWFLNILTRVRVSFKILSGNFQKEPEKEPK